MKGKKNVGLILVLTLVLFFATVVTVGTASARTYYPTTGKTINILVTPNEVTEIYYAPGVKGTKTFSMSTGLLQYSSSNRGTVSFSYADNSWGRYYNPWTTQNYKNSLSVKLNSGTKNICYKIVVKCTTRMYFNADVKIS